MNLFHEFDKYVSAYGKPDHIELMLCDINGIIRGKWLPADQIEKLVSGGVRLPLSTYVPNIFGEDVAETGYGITSGDPDARVITIPKTLKPVTWKNNNVAQVLIEMLSEDGTIPTLSSRQILKNTWEGLMNCGLHPVVACELEFYLFDKREKLTQPPSVPLKNVKAQNYDLEVLDHNKGFLSDVQAASTALGLPTDAIVAEFGPGQFEINFNHTQNILDAADTTVFFKRLVRSIAENHGKEATFMAKPYVNFPGNGMHVHVSMLNGHGENVFKASSGLSAKLKYAIGGLVSTMRELQAIYAPHLNSYRRFHPRSFEPCSPDWSLDNRNASIRLPDLTNDAARIEHRVSGADVNPYLAISGILGGILSGVENKTSIPAAMDSPDRVPVKKLTSDWSEAIDNFSDSETAINIYGKEYRDIYVAIRRNEKDQLAEAISPAEYSAYSGRL